MGTSITPLRQAGAGFLASWTKLLIALSTIVWPLAWRASRKYGRLNALLESGTGERLPSLSIIVPARDEAHNLPGLMQSLKALEFPGACEIIVVDDASTDGTARVACAYGARVISLQQLPAGWLGKPYACHQGALEASGEWLLFTDADTIHAPPSAASAVGYAVSNGLDGLSLFLKQQTSGALESSTLAIAFAGLFAGLSPDAPFLNGQYILVHRDAYLASGGFAAVRRQPLEDLAFGHRLQSDGFVAPIMNGERLASVRMYASRRQMWQGLARLSSGSLRWSGPGAFVAPLMVILSATPLMALVNVAAGRISWKWGAFSWFTTVMGYIPWARRFGSASSGLVAPISANFIQFAAAWGLFQRLLGRGLSWRGRKV
jgi:chlorobactene glucosyltransferase